MFFNDLFHRGEAETDAGPLSGEEWLKDFIDDVCRDRSAVVLDKDLIFDAASRAMLSDLNVEMPAWVHGFTGVLRTEKGFRNP